MTLTELRYIVALYETGHFGKAAEKCHVSQPTLSVAIKKLEDELNIALFERSRSQVKPTPTGERIIEQAQTVLDQVAVIRELADEGSDPLGSILSVGAIFTVGPYLFPRFVPELQDLAPNMPLYIEENFTAVLRAKLRNSELDTIIVALPFNEPDVVTQKLYEENFMVLMPAQHPLAKFECIVPRQLEKEKVLLLGEGHCFRDQVLSACPALKKNLSLASDQLKSVVEGSSLETLKHMVASGLGLTILPQSAVQPDQLATGRLAARPFNAPGATRVIALAWRASFPRHRAIDIVSGAIARIRVGQAADDVVNA